AAPCGGSAMAAASPPMDFQEYPHMESDTPKLAGNRRQFLQLAALGAGASLLAITAGVPRAQAAGNTEALLLSCMDFRLMDEIERYMSGRGLRDKYDHIVLAGASLG